MGEAVGAIESMYNSYVIELKNSIGIANAISKEVSCTSKPVHNMYTVGIVHMHEIKKYTGMLYPAQVFNLPSMLPAPSFIHSSHTTVVELIRL